MTEVVTSLNAVGVLLFFFERNCIAHVTPSQLEIITTEECNRLFWKRLKPTPLATIFYQDEPISVFDMSVYNGHSAWTHHVPCMFKAFVSDV